MSSFFAGVALDRWFFLLIRIIRVVFLLNKTFFRFMAVFSAVAAISIEFFLWNDLFKFLFVSGLLVTRVIMNAT